MLNPFLLWFAALGAVPIIIHLLNKRRYRPVVWAAMEFLMAAIQKNARRLQMRDIILMIIRTLAVICLALALARPTLSAKSLIGGNKTAAVILLDNSLSMGYTTGGSAGGKPETRFDVGKKLSKQILDQFEPGSWCAVYTFNGGIGAKIGPSQNLTYIRQELDNSAVLSDGSTNIKNAFEKAGETLEELEYKQASREIYVITDMQAYPWSAKLASDGFGKALKDISDKAAIYVVNAGDNTVENAAVIDLVPTDTLATVDMPILCVAKIKNFGQVDLKGLVVDFYVDPLAGEEKSAQRSTVDIGAGETSSVSFETKFSTGGDHRVSCRLADDRLPADGHRYCSIEVIDEAKVLLVDGRDQHSDDPLLSETGFLKYALSPKDPDNPDKQNVIATDTIAHQRLADTNIMNYQAVVLSNVPRIPQPVAATLEKQVHNGMGLMIFLGDQVVPKEYNAMLGEAGAKLLPAEIGEAWGEAVAADADKYPPAIGYAIDKLSHPIMADFPAQNCVELLSNVKVYRGYDLKPEKSDSVRPVAMYANGKIAAIEKRVGAGYVLLFASPATTSWSDMPTQPAFAIMMSRAANMLTLGNRPPKNVSVGAPIHALLPPSDQNLAVHITPPLPGTKLDTKPDVIDSRVMIDIKDSETQHAGFYEIVIDRVPKATMAYAVNPDSELESNLNTVAPEQIRQDYPEFKFSYISKNDDLTNRLSQERKGSELWPWLIGAVFLLLALESYLANRWAPRD